MEAIPTSIFVPKYLKKSFLFNLIEGSEFRGDNYLKFMEKYEFGKQINGNFLAFSIGTKIINQKFIINT